MESLTVQIFAGDVGGIDEDFEASSLDEARAIARENTPRGTRGTRILDESGREIETYEP